MPARFEHLLNVDMQNKPVVESQELVPHAQLSALAEEPSIMEHAEVEMLLQ